MKIIDEKGRLFGKLNLIDLLAIVLVLAVAFAIVWKFGIRKAAESTVSDPASITYTVVFEDVQKDIADYARTQIGQPLVNSSKVISARVSDAAAQESAVTPGHVDLFLTVEADGTFSGNVYHVGPQEVRVGYEYILKTSCFELTGLISDMEVSNG